MMPPSDYSESDKQYRTLIEGVLPPVLTYLVRKIVLGLILVNMFAIRAVSNRFGFSLSMEVSDRESWKWELKQKIPRYTAQLKRKD